MYVIKQIQITEPDYLLSIITTTDALCFGYSDGTANITTNGGTMPYSTDWFGKITTLLLEIIVSVTDNNGCTNS